MKRPWDNWSPEMQRLVEDGRRADAQWQRELNGRQSRDEPQHEKGVALARCAIALPLHQRVHKKEHNMLTPTEATIAQQMGITAEQFAHAKKQRGALSSPYPDNNDRFEPHDAADGDPDDDGIPADSDDSAWAHTKRAANHLEAAMDDDEVDMSRVAAARECLSRAIERRAGVSGSKHAKVRFAR